MGDPVVHFEVIGKDPAALRTFYKDAFEWEIDPPIAGSQNDYAIARPHATGGISGGIGGGMEGYAGHVTFYIAVPDVTAALSKAESLGGSTMMGPEDVPGGPTIALFKDPEGHVIGLVTNIG